MSNRGIGLVLTFAVFAAFVIYANWALADLSADLDAADVANAQCKTDVADLGKKLRRAMSERDFAIRRADDAERLMRSAHVKSTDEAFRRLRAQDSVNALRNETAKLRASIAALKAAAIETGSIGKVKPERPAAAPRKPKKRTSAKKVEGPHEWFLWTVPRP